MSQVLARASAGTRRTPVAARAKTLMFFIVFTFVDGRISITPSSDAADAHWSRPGVRCRIPVANYGELDCAGRRSTKDVDQPATSSSEREPWWNSATSRQK